MGTLPSGMVAFLMTDVEGSTKGWNSSTEAMEAAMSRLDADVESIIGSHQGSLVRARGEGDSHFGAFALVSRAVAAAAALQRRSDNRLLLRACVLLGEASPRGDDYLGGFLNHGARIRSVAHGGQVLATRSVVDVASSHLAHDLSFRSLGSHRVRDIPDPIELFQLCGTDLRDSFPPLQTPAFTATALMAVVAVDEVGSSEHYDGAHEQVIAWQRRLIQSIRELCDRHDGRYLKLVGDGCVVGFEDPRAALAFANDVHRRATCRIGIALGLVEVVEGELAGKPLMEAYWLHRKAGPGETQCSTVMEAVSS